MKVDTWMPLYVADYLADTMRLNCEQHGAYMLLIMDYWRNGPPPDDDAVLASITRCTPEQWARIRPALAPKFQIEDRAWKHKRIDGERTKALEKVSVRAVSGGLGAKSRWGGGAGDAGLKRSERLANARRLGTHSPEEWEALLQVCGEECLRCGDSTEKVKDHIVPIYMGGSDAIENIQPLCRSCNSSKGPDQADHRPNDWRERLAERLANARQAPGKSPSPKDKPTTTSPAKPGWQEVVDLYHELMPGNPRVKVVTAVRRTHYLARWKEAMTLKAKPFDGITDHASAVAAWRQFFAVCADSEFLTNKVERGDAHRNFRVDLDWIMTPQNFAKILENRYHGGAQ